MNSLDAHVFFEEIFGIIEPALEQAGYHVLEGDTDTAYVVAPDGENHFEVKLRMCHS